MSDYLVRAMADNDQLRAFAIDATDVVREAQKRHDTFPTASAALGRTLVATLLLSAAEMKGDEKMTVRVLGDGPVGGIVADADAHGHVKGYIQVPHVDLPLKENGHIDVGGAVGKNGTLTVTKDLGLKEPYSGTVELASGEIGDDFTYYLASSEQIPSAVGVSVYVNADGSIGVAGGFMIQVMPGADDATISRLEANLKKLPQVSDLLRDGTTPEQLLDRIFGAGEVKVIAKEPVSFQCDCSKDRFAKGLATLSDKELHSMIDEDHGAETVCKFCGNKYEFTEAELKDILSSKDTQQD
ncbi:33 kDa chaperonin [Lactobacillus selangorensis]|uniref:33 kDa chaperonin n=1 Tax=Lactobacillus selangorensis TaxID=81857 RepID=A0A0R2FYS4_9LACO|nr:Hsp33 family molecular chaperone HslO [Lactobacillus selangorensis]KRN27866.1 33 kDa chaperonin [Lactobacillus selangorensis]KRN30663.1 33 kDa chaperonin [Lactobacillus selangorensis]